MATGRQAFAGGSSAETITAILRDRPVPPCQLNPQLPSRLEEVINKSLEKDRDVRYQRGAELRADLECLRQGTRAQSGTVRWQWPLRLAAMLAMVVVGAAVAWFVRQQTGTQPELKQQQLTSNSAEDPVTGGAISPDGKYLAYTDLTGMHIKLIGTGEAQTIPQPENLKGGSALEGWPLVS